MDINEFFIIIIPSRDGKAYCDTIYTLMETAHNLGKVPMMICADGLNYADARNNCIKKLKGTFENYNLKHNDVVRILFCDNDILIENDITKLVNLIKWADENKRNLIANCHVLWKDGKIINNVMIRNLDDIGYRTMTDAEIKEYIAKTKNNPLDFIVGGLAFYYGDFDLDYKFRLPQLDGTEDIAMFEDLKIPLTLVDLTLLHSKTVMI